MKSFVICIAFLLCGACGTLQEVAGNSVLKTRPPQGSCYEFSYEGAYTEPPGGLDIIGMRRCNVKDREQLSRCKAQSIVNISGGRLTVWTCI